MELEGAKRSFNFLQKAAVKISVFVSDRHRGIAKWIRELQPSVVHYFDQWHISKGVVKKMLGASKKKGVKKYHSGLLVLKPHILVLHIYKTTF
jgi:hypothetical protein